MYGERVDVSTVAITIVFMGQQKDPRFQAWYGNFQATMRSLQRIERDVEAAIGLPMPSIELLININHEDGNRMRMSELADTLLLSRGGATRQVARLEESGYVVREIPPDDRRATYAVLTDKGRDLIDRAAPVLQQAVEDHYLSQLDEGELAGIRTASVKILRETGSNCDWLLEDLAAAVGSADA
jgi:DNA-binding MarR family transcriptional regulator